MSSCHGLSSKTQAKTSKILILEIHTSLYQEKDNLIGAAMNNVRSAFDGFRATHTREDEDVAFAVIGGDFNCDNMSPGERQGNIKFNDLFFIT